MTPREPEDQISGLVHPGSSETLLWSSPTLHPAMRHENLTVSRIHILLRPFETKLSVLARLLEKRVASDVYAPSSRERGVTYAKRHRIRFLTGLSSRQATRAYVLDQQQGIAKRYNVHQQVIGVEDAFRHLVRSVVIPDDQRVSTLRGLIAKMVGRQVAHETLKDKDELEKEGIDDCIGHWYGDLTVDTRRDALVAHALQLVEVKLPVFVPELWSGLLTICLEANLHVEASILLEYILLSLFTPHSSSTECPAAHMGRQLTDLYVEYTTQLPAADFFAILLPIFERSSPHVWTWRVTNHLIRHIDADVISTCLVLHALARNTLFHLISSLSSLHEPMKETLLEVLYARTLALLETLVSKEASEDNEGCTDDVELQKLDYLGYLVHALWTNGVPASSQFYPDYLRLIVAFDAWLLAHSNSDTSELRAVERLGELDTILAEEPARPDMFALFGLFNPATTERIRIRCERAGLHRFKASLELGIQSAERYLARVKKKRKREPTETEERDAVSKRAKLRPSTLQTQTPLADDRPRDDGGTANDDDDQILEKSSSDEEEWNADLGVGEESAGESYHEEEGSSSESSSEEEVGEDEDGKNGNTTRSSPGISSTSKDSRSRSSSRTESVDSRESSPERPKKSANAKARARGKTRAKDRRKLGSNRARQVLKSSKETKTRKRRNSESSAFSLGQLSNQSSSGSVGDEEARVISGSEEEATSTRKSISDEEEELVATGRSTSDNEKEIGSDEGKKGGKSNPHTLKSKYQSRESSLDARPRRRANVKVAESHVDDASSQTESVAYTRTDDAVYHVFNDASSPVGSDVEETSVHTGNVSSEGGDEVDSSVLRVSNRISSLSRYRTPVLHSVLTAKLLQHGRLASPKRRPRKFISSDDELDSYQ